MPKRHRQLWVKDLPKVPTWWLERESNPDERRWLYQSATNAPHNTNNIHTYNLERESNPWPFDSTKAHITHTTYIQYNTYIPNLVHQVNPGLCDLVLDWSGLSGDSWTLILTPNRNSLNSIKTVQDELTYILTIWTKPSHTFLFPDPELPASRNCRISGFSITSGLTVSFCLYMRQTQRWPLGISVQILRTAFVVFRIQSRKKSNSHINSDEQL